MPHTRPLGLPLRVRRIFGPFSRMFITQRGDCGVLSKDPPDRPKTGHGHAPASILRLMASYALSAIGRDRPGIVAEVTGTLLRHGVNLADSQMAILGGYFAMMLVLETSEATDLKALRADLERSRETLELEAISLSEIDAAQARIDEPSHVITLYGADHPGIVNSVTAALAERGVNITDLDTHLVGEESEPVYMMIFEVSLPDGLPGNELEVFLREVAREQKLELSVRALDQVAL
jgi:glycine cleavage system transcriptional repressor